MRGRTMDADMTNLHASVFRASRQLRLHRWLLAVIVCLQAVLGYTLFNPSRMEDHATAFSFRKLRVPITVVDARDRRILLVDVDNHGPKIGVYTLDNRRAMMLRATKAGGGIALFNSNEKVVAEVQPGDL